MSESEPPVAAPVAAPVVAPVVAPVAVPDWQRLDRRMLLVQPFRELMRFLPAVAGLFIAGAASSGSIDLWLQVLGVFVPIALGLARYLTTTFRLTGDRVELRRGLLDRHVLSVRVDRVRTVDLTASPIHRVLGLTTVRIGTGTASTSDEDQIDLDGLRVAPARALRQDLLRTAPPGSSAPGGDISPPQADDPTPVLVLDPTWSRYAPVTSTGLVLTAAVVGFGSQAAGAVGGLGEGLDLDSLLALSGLVLIPLAALGVLTAVTVVAVGGYLVTNWGFTLTHARGSWHLRRGLFTTRETSLDDARVAGVSISEPLGLRLAGAARLSAIVTGLGGEQESSTLVPPAPRRVVDGVAATVLGTSGPLLGDLVPHGPAAVRRRWLRALAPAALGAAALVVAVALGAWTWLLAAAVLGLAAGAGLAHDRSHALGHDLTEGHLVARSGSLLRRRQVLRVDDVIGWTFRSTWFQRRVGLTTLIATTAGGPQAVVVLDVQHHRAVALAAEAMPKLLDQFVGLA